MHQKGIAEDTMRSRLSANNLKNYASPLASTPTMKMRDNNGLFCMMSTLLIFIISDILASMTNALQTVIQSAIKSEHRSPADGNDFLY